MALAALGALGCASRKPEECGLVPGLSLAQCEEVRALKLDPALPEALGNSKADDIDAALLFIQSRVPVLAPKGECKPFQEVLIELAGRLKLPAFVDPEGKRKYRDYPDFIVRHETEPGSGIGFLGGWRGADGSKAMRGEPNPRQWEMYAANDCVFRHELPPSYRYMRNWNRGYMEWAQRARMRRWGEPKELVGHTLPIEPTIDGNIRRWLGTDRRSV